MQKKNKIKFYLTEGLKWLVSIGLIVLIVFVMFSSASYDDTQKALTEIDRLRSEKSNSWDKLVLKSNSIYDELTTIGTMLEEIDPEGKEILYEICHDGYNGGFIHNQDTIYEILDRNKYKFNDKTMQELFKWSLFRINELDESIEELAKEYNDFQREYVDYVESLSSNPIQKLKLKEVIKQYGDAVYEEYEYKEIRNVLIY